MSRCRGSRETGPTDSPSRFRRFRRRLKKQIQKLKWHHCPKATAACCSPFNTQRRQAGGENDAAELPSLPIQRGAAIVECDGLQPGEPMAAAGAAEEDPSLVSQELEQRLVKTGGRLVKHTRYYWLLLAEDHLTRRVFGSILRRIWALPLPTG